MSDIRSGSRLDQLRRLRDRIDLEIQVLEAGERLIAQRQAVKERTADRARRTQERTEQRRSERSDRALAHLDEVAAIEAAAPAQLVRAWAREQGIPIGSHGRLSLDLRKQYLTHLDAQEAAS